MPLKFFNSETAPQNGYGSYKSPIIALDSKNGGFRINKAMCEQLGIKAGDQIEFAQDEESAKTWYVIKVKERGYVLKEKKSTTNGLFFNSSAVSNAIKKSAGLPIEKPGKIKVGEKPVKLQGMFLYPLDLSLLKSK